MTNDELEEKGLVCYCKRCHSLLVSVNESFAGFGWDGSYCVKCGCTDIDICSLDDWLNEEDRIQAIKDEIEWRK